MVQKTNSTVTVDLPRILSNVEKLTDRIQDETRIMAVVKADAYGHGAVEVAGALEPAVGAFAVNDIQEGIELREEGITKPVLVFAVPEQSHASKYRLHNLTATISAEEHFDLLPNGTSYHLNFDTGMGRLGFSPDKARRVAELVSDNRQLFCTGIYSHFATADDPDSEQVFGQHEMFREIRSYFPENISAHIANTGAISFYELEQYNMVRLGIGMYGYAPGETEISNLRPALRWKTRLVQVKTIRAHQTVSYGARWKAPNDGFLGVIPVGYEDGLKRSLSGQAFVRIEGMEFEIVGNITMNYSMVYLQNKTFEVGTEVELLYEGNDARDWAFKLDTIPYEILTSIAPKAKRTYSGRS